MRMKSRWKPRGRGSILSRLTPWMEVPTLIAWFLLDPSSPSSSMFLSNNHSLDFILRCLARKPHDGPLAPGDGLQSGKKMHLLTPKNVPLSSICVSFSLQNIQLSILRNDLSQVVKSWPPVTPYMEAPPWSFSPRATESTASCLTLQLVGFKTRGFLVSFLISFFRRVCPHRPWDDV